MFKFLRSKKKTEIENNLEPSVPYDQNPQSTSQPSQQKIGFFTRLRQGLKRTRGQLTDGIANLLLGKKTIDDELFEELETQLLVADVGVEAAKHILADVALQVKRHQLTDAHALLQTLKQELTAILQPCSQPLIVPSATTPFVILMVGVNGSGKTTTIGKLAHYFQQQNKKVMLAAGDTFRAAAVEQLQVWGERNQVPVIAQQSGADSAAVIFDALQAAQSRHVDILIADTAGRLHTKTNLMEELKKIQRVLAKLDSQAPHEVMLVLDAGIGQNALVQAQQFNQAIPLTGLVVTKLDGTAKGGVIFALAKRMKLPIRFIGVGEGMEDLQVFNAEQFTAALFDL